MDRKDGTADGKVIYLYITTRGYRQVKTAVVERSGGEGRFLQG